MRFKEFFDQQADEMIGVKKYHGLTAAQVMKKASEELGLPMMGRGAFGKVIQSPNPNWVYKIYEKDSAYDDYVDFLQQHPNKHYPVIKKVKKMTNFFKRYGIQENKFTVVVIEKLEKIPEKKMQLVLNIVKMPHWNPDRLNLRHKIKDEDLPEIKSLWMAAADIRYSHVADGGRFMDLHSGNVMQRADGTVVIIDPVAGYDALDYEGDIAHARFSGEPMIKGPHYKTEPAQASPDDDPDNPHAPPPPDSFFTPRTPPSDPYEVPLSQQARMGWDKSNTSQWNDRPSNAKKPINSPSEAQAEFDMIMNKPNRSTEDLQRADELNDYLEKEFDRKWKKSEPTKHGVTRGAEDLYQKLLNKTNLNPYEEAVKRRLAAFLDQKRKIKK